MLEMGMTTAWCLACSKQLDNARSTYCSDYCRYQDAHSTAVDLPQPVPHRPSSLDPSSPTYADKPCRPAVQPHALHNQPHSSTGPRDRRAYSFPAEVTQSPVRYAGPRRQTQTQETLQFVRRSYGAPISARKSPALHATSAAGPVYVSKGFGQLSKSTGHNTPFMPDSVFCSNSESSEDDSANRCHQDPDLLGKQQELGIAAYSSETVRLPKVPVPRRLSSIAYDSYDSRPSLYPARPSSTAAVSPNSVAHMIANSASSKSRDDIVSWLNEVKGSPKSSSVDLSSRRRGELLTPAPERNQLEVKGGTTPQGTLGSALSSLRGFSMVKALSHVAPGSILPTTSSAAFASANNTEPCANGFTIGPQIAPAQTEVSKVAVTAVPSERDESMIQPGATPTLSTISLSEVLDSLTDIGDNIDFLTDEQSVADSSSFARHRLSISTSKLPPNGNMEWSADKATALKTSSPMRHVAKTANAIWNFSAYLRSFSPLSVTSVLSRPTAECPAPPLGKVTPPKPPSPRAQTSPAVRRVSVASPLPTAPRRPNASAPGSTKEMVRSLPMDIVNPAGVQSGALEGKIRRQQEVALGLGTSSTPFAESKSRSRSRVRDPRGSRIRTSSPSPSRSRGRSAGRRSRAREVSKARESHSRHKRKVSYDEDGGEDKESGSERRGRSKMEKRLPAESLDVFEDERRGRDRAVRG